MTLAADSRAGSLGLLVVLLMIVATVLLIKNMNSRLKRLPATFDGADPESGTTESEDEDPAT